MQQFDIRILRFRVPVLVAYLALSLCALGTSTSIAGNVPPGFTMSRTGSVHDFDYFVGGWTTHQHVMLKRGTPAAHWVDFSSTLCMQEYLGGMATVDEFYLPIDQAFGLTLRTFDPSTRQWSIYWVNSKTGQLGLPPVVGGFQGSRGEFYSSDTDNGRPIKVRFLWTLVDRDHAHWAQAFSYDNQTWQTNWTADFTRADTAAACDSGRPKKW